MWEDPIVAEVRRIREELAARYNYDVKAMFADLRKRETVHGERLVSQKRPAQTTPPDRPVDEGASQSQGQSND